MIDLIQSTQTTHLQGPGDALGYDGNIETYIDIAASEHMFGSAKYVKAITLYASIYADLREYGQSAYGYYYTQYTLNGTDWITFDVPRGTLWDYHTATGSRGDFKFDPAFDEYPVDVRNVVSVRVVMQAVGPAGVHPPHKRLKELGVWIDGGGSYCGII